MLSYALLLPALALGAVAQSTTTARVFLGAEATTNQFVGSVVAADASSTTYALVCTAGDPAFCGNDITLSITEGPTFFEALSTTVTAGETAVLSESCSLAGTMSALCTASISLNVDGTSTATTTQTTLGSDQMNYFQIPITAGAEKLASASSAAATHTSSSKNAAVGRNGGRSWVAGAGLLVLAAALA